jgi:hypothetical protein
MSESSSGRAQATRQSTIIAGHEKETTPFSPFLFAAKSHRHMQKLVLSSAPSDVVIDFKFDQSSVVEFIDACEGANSG